MLPLGEEARWMDGSPSLGQHDQNRQAEKKGRKDLVMEEAERRKGRKGGGERRVIGIPSYYHVKPRQ